MAGRIEVKRILWKIRRKFFPPEVLQCRRVVGDALPRERRTRSGDRYGTFIIENVTRLDDLFLELDRSRPALFGELIRPEHSIFIKINLNSADPFPASTCPHMLRELLGFLFNRGHRRIQVGDCSGIGALPTRRVARKTGVLRVLGDDTRFLDFDRGSWVRVKLPGTHLKSVTVPEGVLKADRIISLANMKTHQFADYTFGLKLAVGYMHPLERYELHRHHLQEKVVEINLALPADLTLIDGREAFITGGPHMGRKEPCAVVMAGTDPVRVDAAAYRRLYRLKEEQGCLNGFPPDPFATRQLGHALRIGLGGGAAGGCGQS